MTLSPQDDSICTRSLKTSALVVALLTLALLNTAHHAWAWGFLIGALLSLFSLLSLTVLVPFLFRAHEVSRYSSALLVMTLFMKIPLFMVGLYLITHLPGVSPAASVLGIGLAPIVISLKTMAGLLVQTDTVAATNSAETSRVLAPLAVEPLTRSRAKTPVASSPVVPDLTPEQA